MTTPLGSFVTYVVIGFLSIALINSFSMPWDPHLKGLFDPWLAVCVVSIMWIALGIFAFRRTPNLKMRVAAFTVFLVSGFFWKASYSTAPKFSVVSGLVLVIGVILVNMALDKKEVASMGDPSQAPTIKRVLAVTLLAALPAMFIAAYFVWTVRGFLEGIHPLFYESVLILAMFGALWLTARRLLKELREHAKWREEQRARERGS